MDRQLTFDPVENTLDNLDKDRLVNQWWQENWIITYRAMIMDPYLTTLTNVNLRR